MCIVNEGVKIGTYMKSKKEIGNEKGRGRERE